MAEPTDGPSLPACDAPGWGRRTLPLLGLMLATLGMTWPVAATALHRFAGKWPDLCVTLWDIEWVRRVVLEGEAPLHTTDLFYPQGTGLSYHSISWLSGLWALPLRAAFGPALGYNLLFLSQTFACACAMYLLVHQLLGRRDCAWLAALVFAFAPQRMDEAVSHPNLAATCFVPLCLLGFWKGTREPRARWVWVSAVGLALTLWTGVHLFIMTALGVFTFWLADGLLMGRVRSRAFWAWSLRVAGACLLCCALPLAQFAVDADGMAGALQVRAGSGRAVDPLGLLLPRGNHPVLGSVAAWLRGALGEPTSRRVYVGLLPLLLAALGVAAPGTRRRAFAALGVAAGLLLLLSLGPRLTLAGHRTGLAMPLLPIADFPAVAALRHPDRFLLVFSAFFAPLVARGAGAVLSGPRRRVWVVVVLGLWTLWEYRGGPYPTSDQGPAPIYGRLPGDGLALLELPLSRDRGKRSMLQQSYHRRPLVGGMVARATRGQYAFIERSPLLRRFRRLGGGRRVPRYRCRDFDLRAEWARLHGAGVGYVVLDGRWRGARSANLAAYLPSAPLAAVGGLRAYSVAQLARTTPACR